MKRLSTPRRLRLLLGTLFLALALPSALLIWRTERQIRLEGWHQQREAAEALTRAIDARLQRLLQGEETKGYGDYRFLTVAGDPARGVLSQRSPLAQLPDDAAAPGLLGHFQIDPEGRFSTPLLPEDGGHARDLGMDGAEWETRLALRAGLIEVLAQNRLLSRDVAVASSDADGLEEEFDRIVPEDARFASQAAFDRLNIVPPSPQQGEGKGPTFEESTEDAYKQSTERSARRERSAVLQSAPAPASAPQYMPAESEPPAVGRQAPSVRGLAGRDEAGLDTITVTGARIRRGDIEEATREAEDAAPAVAEVALPPAPRIDIFESVLDPFEFSRLDSGHFVLFRRVWNDGGRSIQGVLLDADRFLDSELLAPFRASPLAGAATLAVGWRGVSIDSIPGSGPLEDPLHRHRLSAPFGDLELSLTLNRLDPGPGALLTRWTGMVLLAVLLLGFILLYRLGLSQLRLARQQQDFVAAVSHELKTPLTSIRMYGELLREGWVPEDKRREYYAYIHDESERLSRLIGNVLQLARMERQELALEIKPMAVGELFDLARSRLAAQIARAGFEASFELDPAVATRQVSVDSDALLQILINLVDNALKFSARAVERRVDIAVRAAERGAIELSVRDHGPGVARAQMRRIFELFYRASDTLTRETVGTGIGLALVRQLAVAMDGSVDVVNREPGAEFRVRFPLVPSAL
ncbi:MAG TPA: ATP-binding protein [Xanthomonadaceae bacterium]|nr:ATP-binding protein [Xanthomonadaceae bacterium]